MNPLLMILLSTFLVSAISFIGMLALVKEKRLKKIVLFLVALSAGALLGGAFLHLIPESFEEFPNTIIFFYVLIGFACFFLIEKFLYWRHCHDGKCPKHTFAYMNLVGDAVHNFIDGLIIAPAFLISPGLGLVTALAVALHEVPQEIGDFGVLIYGGYKKQRALILNYACASTVLLGGLFGYFLSSFIGAAKSFLLPFAAGGFIYIAASDLIPELKKERDYKRSLLVFIIFLLGILLMYLIKA